MSTFIIAALIVIVSVSVLAYALNRRRAQAGSGGAIRKALGFISGPFPLSVSIHVLILLLLIITVHESRGRELIMINLEAGGGGGGGDEMHDLDLGEQAMPDLPPPSIDTPPTEADVSGAVALADSYARSPNGIGIGRGSGVGSGHGPGFGSGWGGFITTLRRNGFDVVLVIDGTGSMRLVINEVRAQMRALVMAIQRLVPTARIGIVVYGGKHEPIAMQPLTISAARLESFLDSIRATGGDEWQENVGGAMETAVNKMDWKDYATKVIVVVPDSPPQKNDLPSLMALARGFHARRGIINAIDLTEIEHARFERAFARQVHGCTDSDPACSGNAGGALPAFYRQTQLAYQVITREGGGEMRALHPDQRINEEVMILAFGEKWRSMVEGFARR